VPDLSAILIASGNEQTKPFDNLNGEIRSLIILKASPLAVFFVFSGLFPCPKCGGKNNYSVKDVTPDRISDQLIRQAPQGIQGLYLVDISAFTGGGTVTHNAQVFPGRGGLCRT
jgi:hypothetical protein